MPVESFFGDASLAFIASTESAKEGTAYSMKPTDGSGDFTFTRGSNLSATYVGKDGYIKKGYENFLRQSNSFLTSPWQLSNGADVTPNHSGYDGTNDAWYLYKNTGTTTQLIKQDVSLTGVQTFSFYAKAEELEWIRFLWYGATGGRNHFHLVGDGDFGVGANIVSRNIEALGNGWYKCSTTINDSVTQIQIFPASGENSVSGSTGGVYIQDAMLNQGLVAYPYLETTGVKAINALTDNEPRYDWSSGSAALLLEPGRTNLIIQSETSAGWNYQSPISVTSNSSISPEGVNNAIKITKVADGNMFYRIYTTPVIGCFSVFAKKGNWRYIGLRNNQASGNDHSVFDFDTQTFVKEASGQTCTFQDYGNGWYRLNAYQPNNEASGLYGIALTDENGNENSYTSPVPNGSYLYVYGFQLEQNATYPTSYIPTYGTTEERLEDNCHSLNVSNLPTAYPFTLYAEVPVIDGIGCNILTFSNISSGGEYYSLTYDKYGRFYFTLRPKNSIEYVYSLDTYGSGTHKVAAVITDSYAELFVNGTSQGTTSNIAEFNSSINDLLIGQLRVNADSGSRRPVKQALVFNYALSYDDCISLTTL